MAPVVEIAKGSLSVALGEGPHWDSLKQELLYVDILGKGVVRYVPKTEECYRVNIDGGAVSLVVPVDKEPNKYLISVGRALHVLEWDGKSPKPTSLKPIHTVDEEEGIEKNRFNDGKCDSKGRLWAGTMGNFDQSTLWLDPKKGSMFSLTNGTIKKHFGGIDISNGIAWSPDNKTMYFIDSFAYGVDAFDFNVDTGSLSNRRTIFDFKTNGIDKGIPDGMTSDSDGNLWIAVFDGGRVIHANPTTGKIIREIEIPSPPRKITSVAFGGPKLDTLYVTCACNFSKEGKPIEGPGGGALFAITGLDVTGLSAGYNYIGKL